MNLGSACDETRNEKIKHHHDAHLFFAAANSVDSPKFIKMTSLVAILFFFSLFVRGKVVENPETFHKRPGTVPRLFRNVSNSLPSDFIWGYASSAPQVEGAVDVDGKSPSQWDAFSAKKGIITIFTLES